MFVITLLTRGRKPLAAHLNHFRMFMLTTIIRFDLTTSNHIWNIREPTTITFLDALKVLASAPTMVVPTSAFSPFRKNHTRDDLVGNGVVQFDHARRGGFEITQRYGDYYGSEL